jgi:hypothetical protein
MDVPFRATLMSADTGASEVYGFQAESDLFRRPAKRIVRAFMDHMTAERRWTHAPSYKLDSATKKGKKQVVMATGSLLLEKGELPFLLMISPDSGATAGT